MSEALVFVYGCLTDLGTMRARAPSAVPVKTALLEGHTYGFCGSSRGWGGGVATVIETRTPHEGTRVPGVVWRVSRHDLAALDQFEGVPWLYTREELEVEGPLPFYFYVHTPAPLAEPSPSYLDAINRGLRSFGLPTQHVARAVKRAQRFEAAQKAAEAAKVARKPSKRAVAKPREVWTAVDELAAWTEERLAWEREGG